MARVPIYSLIILIMFASCYWTSWYCNSELIAPDTLRRALTKACIWSLTWLRDFTPSFPSRLLNLTLHSISNGLLLDRGEAFRFWRGIIKLYTVRCLTFDRDALPAISGLARLIQQRVLDTYLAGFWREDLHRELLWCKSRTPIPFTTRRLRIA